MDIGIVRIENERPNSIGGGRRVPYRSFLLRRVKAPLLA
jgi:hypothetical protein